MSNTFGERPGYPLTYNWFQSFPAGSRVYESAILRAGKLPRLPAWFGDVHELEGLHIALALAEGRDGLRYMMMLDYERRVPGDGFTAGDFEVELDMEDYPGGLNRLIPQDGRYLDDQRPDALDELNADLLEALAVARAEAEPAFRLLGGHWEFTGGVTPAPPLTVLKYPASSPGAPAQAVYPPTRTRSEAPAVRPAVPPRAVYAPV